MTTTQTKEVTLSFSHDDGETTTTVRAEVEYYEYYHQYDQKWLREFRVEFLEPFDKDSHGMWKSELNDQVKAL